MTLGTKTKGTAKMLGRRRSWTRFGIGTSALALLCGTLSLLSLTGFAAASSTSKRAQQVQLPPRLARAIQHRLGSAGLVRSYTPSGGLHLAEAAKPSLSWSLIPVGISRGHTFSAAHVAEERRSHSATSFDLGPFSSWYRTSTAGVEQGFTIATEPAGNGSNLSIVMGAKGTLAPKLTGPSTLSLRHADTSVLTYGALAVHDASGMTLPSHLSLHGHSLRIVIDAAHADYPLVVDPLVQQALLTMANGAAGDYLGASVAISSNGAVAVAGAYGASSDEGEAVVFSGTNWATQTVLTAANATAGDLFGTSVAISANGSTIVVGARNHQVGSNFLQGEAVVFSGTNWATQTDLTAANGAASDQLGRSVAISANGSTIVAGAPTHQVGSNTDQGEAVVFSGTNWATQTDLTAANGAASDQLGTSVAISADGSTIVAGAPSHQVGFNNGAGEAVAFSGTNFGTETDLTAANGAAFDELGRSVAVSANGSTIVAGAPSHQVGSNAVQGEAVVFSGTNFGTENVLTAANGAASDEFGLSVAVSGDGSTIVAGAPFHQVASNADEGEAVVFSGTNWATQTDLTAANSAASDLFGAAVAISSGSTVLAGALEHQVGSNIGEGEAVIFGPSPVTVTVSGSQAYGSSSPSFTYTTSPSGVSISSISCSEIGPSTLIDSSLASGSYTILGSSCTASVEPGYAATFVGATNGFSVAAAPQSPVATTEPVASPTVTINSTTQSHSNRHLIIANVTCKYTACVGSVDLSVARRRGRSYVHLILARASYHLAAGQTVSLHLHVTKVGLAILPRSDGKRRWRTTATVRCKGTLAIFRRVYVQWRKTRH